MLPTNFYFWLDNKNVDIKFNAHDASLEQPPPGMLKIERLESQIKVLRAIKPKGLNRMIFKIDIKKLNYICLLGSNLLHGVAEKDFIFLF